MSLVGITLFAVLLQAVWTEDATFDKKTRDKDFDIKRAYLEDCNLPDLSLRFINSSTNQDGAIFVPGVLKASLCFAIDEAAADAQQADFKSPLKAQLDIQSYFKLLGYVNVPCVAGLGSCTYDNICELNPYEKQKTCPVGFGTTPCHCSQFKSYGEYCIKNLPLEIPGNNYPIYGNYKAKITLLDKKDTVVGCAQAEFTLENREEMKDAKTEL